jgi:predicted transposase YdaD
VLDLIETILLYKLPQISRQELAAMFGIVDIKKTRYYRELKEEVHADIKEEVREEVKEEIRKEVKREEALELVQRLLVRRVRTLNSEAEKIIQELSVEQLENLAESLLDFSTQDDLRNWLQTSSGQFPQSLIPNEDNKNLKK